MRALLVDNGTYFRKKLLKLLEEMDVVAINYDDISSDLIDEKFDLVVLSGAGNNSNSVKYHAERVWIKEKELIENTEAPVIGICFGAQLIAHHYGAKLSIVPGGRVKGLKRIWNVKQTPFNFFRYYGGLVFSSQKWRITELSKKLDCWCASGEGVEVFRHVEKPVYGLQFHPERRLKRNDGARIFFTIVKEETGFKSKKLKTALSTPKKQAGV